MGRIVVVLKDKLLDEIDAEAIKKHTNRNAVIRAALEKYIDGKRREREEGESRKRMRNACRKIDMLARKLGEWSAESTIRKFRNHVPFPITDK